MRIFHARARAKRLRSLARPAIGLAALGTLVAVMAASIAGAAATSVLLGTTESFAVLAGAGITNTGPTTIGGDIGTFPTTGITGSAGMTVNGANHAGDAVTQQAKSDLVVAYDDAAAQGPTSPTGTDLGGRTLVPGVYNSASSVGLTGTVTLDAGGDPSAVFVFQVGSSLTTASASRVALVNGAQSCNVFWQIGSSATLGTGSTFRGSIFALTDITVTTNVTVDGRVLARNGAVTLDSDTITKPTCATGTGTGTGTGTTPGTGTGTTPGTTTTPGTDTGGTTPPAGATDADTTTGAPGTGTPPTVTPGPDTSSSSTATATARAKKVAAARRKATAKRRAAAAKAAAAARAAAARRLVSARGFARPARRHVGFTG